MCVFAFFYEKILLGINPTKEHDKTYSSTHYQGINQVERVLSDTARADGIVLVSNGQDREE